MALTGSLQDNFNDNVKDTAKWASTTTIVGYLASAGASLTGSASETGGQVVVTPADTANGANGYSSFDTALDLRSSEVYVKLTDFETTESEFYLTVADTASPSGAYIHWRVRREGAGGGFAINKTAFYWYFGNAGTTFDEAWDSTNDVWLRIRESGGFTYWDTAPDNGGAPGTWVNKRVYDTSALFVPNAVTVAVYGYNNAGNASISWSFDSFNTAAAATAAKRVLLLNVG